MNRAFSRILIGFLGPAPLSLLFVIFIGEFKREVSTEITLATATIQGFLALLLIAYLFIGIQSLVYAVLMEYVINKYIANTIFAVAISTVLGACSGATISQTHLGTFIGLILGVVLRFMYARSALTRPSN